MISDAPNGCSSRRGGRALPSARTPRSLAQLQRSSPLPGKGTPHALKAREDPGCGTPRKTSEAEHTEASTAGNDSENESNFKVAVRVRPFNTREAEEKQSLCCILHGGGRRVSLPAPHSRTYEFDRVFSPEATQEDAYACVSPLLRAAVDGLNAALLAYGQTGSGKTYTLGFEGGRKGLQCDSRSGVLPRACHDLFCLQEEKIKRCKVQGETLDVQVTCSFLELYNEEIRDLLSEAPPLKSLIIRRDAASGQPTVQDLLSVPCSSPQDLLTCLQKGSQRRTTGATAQNNVSSRSHAIFSISLKQQMTSITTPKALSPGKEMANNSSTNAAAAVASRVVFSVLQFVDLAGSERGKKSGTGGHRLTEGIAINSGLLALAKVIRALTQQQKKKGPQQQQQQHVPYRDSKLTRLLEPVLGGNSKAVMIACVSPSERDLNETVQTLDYAARARLIKNSPTINSKPTGDLIASLKEEIQRLKHLLSSRDTPNSEETPNARLQYAQQHQQLVMEASVPVSPRVALTDREETEEQRLRRELNRLANETVCLKRHIEILEGQLQLQLERQQQQQQHQEGLAAVACAATTPESNAAAAPTTTARRETGLEETPGDKVMQHRLPRAESPGISEGLQGGARESDRDDEQQEMVQVQKKSILLLREQQLLQRERQLHQVVFLQKQQQQQMRQHQQQQRVQDQLVKQQLVQQQQQVERQQEQHQPVQQQRRQNVQDQQQQQLRWQLHDLKHHQQKKQAEEVLQQPQRQQQVQHSLRAQPNIKSVGQVEVQLYDQTLQNTRPHPLHPNHPNRLQPELLQQQDRHQGQHQQQQIGNQTVKWHQQQLLESSQHQEDHPSLQQNPAESCVTGADRLSKVSAMFVHQCAEGAAGPVPLNNADEGDETLQGAWPSSSRSVPLLEPCWEESLTGSPLRKRKRTEETPTVLFRVVEGAHESPIRKACFVPVGPQADLVAFPAGPLLTASNSSFKMWDIEQMAPRWKYSINKNAGACAAGNVLPSFWGLAPALNGSCVVAGINNSIQSFDIREGKPQRRDAWPLRGGSPYCLAVGGEGCGGRGCLLFVSSLDGFVRLYDLRKLECSDYIGKTECGEVSSMCWLSRPSQRVSCAASPFAGLAVSSFSESPRVFVGNSWLSLGGPCCSSLAAFPRRCMEQAWRPRRERSSSEDGSLLAGLEGERGILRVWDLQAGVSASAVSALTPVSLPISSCGNPSAAAGRTEEETTVAEKSTFDSTSLATWETRRCCVTADSAGFIRFWQCRATCAAETTDDQNILPSPPLRISPQANMPRQIRTGGTAVTALVSGGRELLLSGSADCSLRLFRIRGD